MTLRSALQACADWIYKAPRLPGPEPERRANLALLDSCEIWDQAGSLSLAQGALRDGADPEAKRGARSAAMSALAHGNCELALLLHARTGSLSRPDAHGLMPLERILLDDDIGDQARERAVPLLLGLGAAPKGDPRRASPLSLAIGLGLDGAARSLLSMMPEASPETLLPELSPSPLICACLASGLPSSSLLLIERAQRTPEGLAWLIAHASSLCLCSLSIPREKRGLSSRLLHLALSQSDDPHAPLLQADLDQALLWIGALPVFNRGGDPRAMDSAPAPFGAMALDMHQKPLSLHAALLALGASKEDVERATAVAEFGRLSEKVQAGSSPASSPRL